ncbi:histidine utilization protein HutD [Paraburkholderia caribensis]|uniref:Histidine utilization protein HutD n=1 Tax=Paraburkholderia caribensis TaxID=75105 RepID=A0A9Q6S319_9BURK|nr:histidine utilization protein HutD [Paraburkholderia caribensis]QLB63635.1 histidine utilization protein HutD [Paraburkholderia caribensis]
MTAPRSTASVSLIRGADLVASPWKNGGGVTREVAAFPEGAALDSFVWRVSVADVAQAGPFSRFAGIDRTLVLLSGAGMLLDEAGGATHTLREPLDIARFEGEMAIDARLIDGATRDFNLMVRRGAATGDVAIWRDPTHTQLDADVVLLFCAQGELHVATDNAANTTTLVTMDTLRIDHARALSCEVTGKGALLAISIRYLDTSQA